MPGLRISIIFLFFISYFLFLISYFLVLISYFNFEEDHHHLEKATVATVAKWGNQAISQSNQSDQHGIEQHQLYFKEYNAIQQLVRVV